MTDDPRPPAATISPETAAWYWLAYVSGLSLARAKQIILQQVAGQGKSLYEILHLPAESAVEQLALDAAEAQVAARWPEAARGVLAQLAAWESGGLGMWRLNERDYPPTLSAHLAPMQRPLLLHYVGEPGLIELPAVLAHAGEEVDEETVAWTTGTLLELAGEGALPLAVARRGLDADIVRGLLAAQAPLALVLPRGLAGYEPPPPLAEALAGGRALLLSPFPPDYEAPAAQAATLQKHAAAFAQALAHALLLIAPPYPERLHPEQPCFLRPGAPATVGCRADYSDAEDFFLRLIEAPVAAAQAQAPPPVATPAASAAAEPPLDPEALIERLSQLGRLPDAMRERLRAAARAQDED